MARKNLNCEVILSSAIDAVRENGYDNFSIRDLAARLDCKPASLYNHISGFEELKGKMAIFVANELKNTISSSIEGKAGDEAFFAAVRAYRTFAIENHNLYSVFISIPSIKNQTVDHAGFDSFTPLLNIINGYNLSPGDKLNYIRALRSVMHGFIELTANGFMQKGDISRDQSYEAIMTKYLEILKQKGNM